MVIEGPNCLGLVNHRRWRRTDLRRTPGRPLGAGPAIGIVCAERGDGLRARRHACEPRARPSPTPSRRATRRRAASRTTSSISLGDPARASIGMIVEQFREPAALSCAGAPARARGQADRAAASRAQQRGARSRPRPTRARWQATTRSCARKSRARASCWWRRLEELGDILEHAFCAGATPPLGRHVVVTESGAFKALTLDLCEQVGLALPELDDADGAGAARGDARHSCRSAIRSISPPRDWSIPDIYRRTLAASRCGRALRHDRARHHPDGCRDCEAEISDHHAAIRELAAKAVVFAGLDEGAVVPAPYVRELRNARRPLFSISRSSCSRAGATHRGIRTPVAPAPLAPRTSSPLRDEELPAGVVPEYRAKSVSGPPESPFPLVDWSQTLEQAERPPTPGLSGRAQGAIGGPSA